MTEHLPSGRAEAFLARQHRMLIGSEWVAAQSGVSFVVKSPASEREIAAVPRGDAVDVDLAVQAARVAFQDGRWCKLPTGARARVLWRIAELIDAHRDDLAELDCIDNGMPITDAQQMGVPFAAEVFRYYAGW